MGAFLFIAGIIWFVVEVYKDASIHDVTKNGDFDARQAYMDQDKYSKKELNRRINVGCYNTGKKDQFRQKVDFMRSDWRKINERI